MSGVVVVDVGNSTITIAHLDGSRILVRDTIPHSGGEPLAGLARFCAVIPSETPVFVAGVHPAALARVTALLVPCFRTLVAPADFIAPIENLCEPPGSVGQDRLFDAAAAVAGYGSPVVIVDAGTAVTVDLVDECGRFRGGAIAPGLGMSLRALRNTTGVLPRVGLEPSDRPVPAIGTNTEAAMRSGVVRGISGLIDRLVEEIGAVPGGPVVLTGGDGPRLLPLLRCAPHFDADLTLRGIALGATLRLREG